MTNLRAILLALAAAALVGACTGTAAQPSSSPSASLGGGNVDTPEAAVAAVVATDPRFSGIEPFAPDLIGQSSWYKVMPASGVGAYLVQMRVGWGDCQAGCIDEHIWTFAVLPDGTVNLQSETGPAVPADASPQPAGAGETGIAGVAVAGPTCPVQKVGDPACAPRPVADATIVVVDGSGVEVARTRTGMDGAFSVAVPAGDYTAAGEPVNGLMGTPGPIAVAVSEGSVSQIQLSYDTGIR
jgi:hypothetical protein